MILGLLRRTATLLGLVIALLGLLGGILGRSFRGSFDGRFVIGQSRGLVGCLLGRRLGRRTLGRLLGLDSLGFFDCHVVNRRFGGFGFSDGHGCNRKLEERRRRVYSC
jgi:hypothetical protein